MKKFGIDISHWQKGLSLATAKKEGVEFAILKAGGSDAGHYKDSSFESFYLQAKQLGLPVGAYYFGKDMTTAQAKESAKHFVELLKGKQFEYPVYYDVEAKMLTLSKQQLTDVVNTFCKYVEEQGYWVGIYASLSTFNSEMDAKQISHWCKWVAAYRKTQPSIGDIWQFGGTQNFIRSNKIAGRVCDQDYCYKDYPALIKAKGLNGWGKATPQPEKKTEEKKEEPKTEQKTAVVKYTVKKGDTLSSIAKKYKTTVAKLAKANGIKEPNKIYVGQVLTIA